MFGFRRGHPHGHDHRVADRNPLDAAGGDHAPGDHASGGAGYPGDHRHARGWPGDGHDHPFGPGHGHGRGRGGRLGRFFEHGDLRLVILHLIAQKPRHGYEIIKAIEDRTGGSYSPSPGTIYPALAMLEEQGHVAIAPGEGAKKLHVITDQGRDFLAVNRVAVEILFRQMDKAGAAHRPLSPQLVRATENLKLALRLRLDRQPLDAVQLQAICDILDRAASEIDRT
ncbi:MAG: PadR family transcriptional regulator [Telmatospirillum sp.]|nr:PadR family transcriptional regulator [Telmatospirillum sp.]